MKSFEDYREWFRSKAQELPYLDRLEVLNTIDTSDPRKMCLELARMRDAGRLPADWHEVIKQLLRLRVLEQSLGRVH